MITRTNTDLTDEKIQQRFREMIYAEPDNDDARLVYADYLQERGDPRGEFIALQYARDASAPESFEYKHLHFQVESMCYTWGQRFIGEDLPGFEFPTGEAVYFYKGFFAGVLGIQTTSAQNLITRVEAFKYPLIMKLELFSYPNPSIHNINVARIADSPLFRNLTYLGVKYASNDAALSIANSAHLRKLEGLSLQHNQLSEVGVRQLIRSPNLQNVTFLELNSFNINDAWIGELLDAPKLEHLRTLGLWGSAVASLDGTLIRQLHEKYNSVSFLPPGVCLRLSDV